MPNQPKSRLTLREFYRVMFRFRRRAILFFVGTIAAICIGLAVCPRQYTSVAKLLVRVGRESVGLDPTVTTGNLLRIEKSQKAEINSVKEMLSSRTVLEGVVAAIEDEATTGSTSAREAAVRKLGKRVSISTPKESNVLVLEYEASSPELAQRTLKKLIEIYLEEHLRVHRTAGSYEFFDQQTASLKQQMDTAIESLRAAKSEFGLVSITGRRASLQDQINQVQSQMLDTESGLSASLAKLDTVQDTLSHLPNPFVRQFAGEMTDQSSANMREQLYALETREQDVLSKYTPEHPEAVAIRRQVMEAKRILESEQPDRGQAATAVMLTEHSNAKSLQARAASLTSQMARLTTELAELNQQEVRIDQLQRSVNVLEQNYLTNVKSLELARIDRELHRKGITNVNLIQEPSYVTKPSSPRKGLALAAALMIATLGAVGVAVVSDQIDHTLATPEMVEDKLNLPILVSIPRFTKKQIASSGWS